MAQPLGCTTCRLHIGVVWAAETFGGYPGDILAWILDVAGLAVNTVLTVNLKLLFAAFLDNLINTGRAITLRWLIEDGQVMRKRDAGIL